MERQLFTSPLFFVLLDMVVTEFSEELWCSRVDHVTVHSKDNIIFTLTSRMEIKA